LLAGLFCPVLAAPIALTDDPMVIGGGARPIGMGRAFSAVADDADAPFINPAGLAGLKGPQLMTMFTNLLGEVYYTEYAGAMPTTFGTLGIGYVNTGVSRVTVPVGSSFVYADYHDTLLLLSYGTPLSRFFFYGRNLYAGLNAKIFSRGWTGGYTESASGFNLDLGLKYVLTPYLTFGLNRQNFLPMSLGGVVKLSSGAEEAIAGVTKLGVAVKPIPWGGKVLFAYDVDLPAQSGRPVTMHFGTEWKVSPNLTVRGGLDQSVDAAAASGTSWNPAFGASTELGGFRVDLAHHPYYNDPALANNYISFSYQGAPWYALSGEIR
jgi:long-subunit fatty acid transport protein